jgi:hypothetical protein
MACPLISFQLYLQVGVNLKIPNNIKKQHTTKKNTKLKEGHSQEKINMPK